MNTVSKLDKRVKVVVLGSINCDISSFVYDFPSPNQTISAHDSSLSIGGKGLNQAIATHRAGGETHFLGCVGDDTFGSIALKYLLDNSIDTSYVKQVAGSDTGIANILVNNIGQNMIVVSSGANQHLSIKDVELAEDIIQHADIAIAQLETPVKTVEFFLSTAKKHNVTTLLNPAPALDNIQKLFALADFITPNEIETRQLSGIDPLAENDKDSMSNAAQALHNMGAKNIVMTLGSHGCYISINQSQKLIPAYNVDVQNTTGAGDVFNGVFAVSIAENKTMEESAHIANAASAISVTEISATKTAPTRTQISKFLKLQNNTYLSSESTAVLLE